MATKNSSRLISSVYNSRRILLDLMAKQGYNTSEYKDFSINEVNSMNNHKQLDMLMEHPEKKTKIYITFANDKALTSKIVTEIIEDLFEEILTKKDTLMIISKEEINDSMMSLLKHIWEQDEILVIIQCIKSLQYNILDHVLIPPHRIMSEQEVVEMKRRWNIHSDTDLPEISRFDPVAQIIGIRPGEICEILRPSKTAIVAPYYRYMAQHLRSDVT